MQNLCQPLLSTGSCKGNWQLAHTDLTAGLQPVMTVAAYLKAVKIWVQGWDLEACEPYLYREGVSWLCLHFISIPQCTGYTKSDYIRLIRLIYLNLFLLTEVKFVCLHHLSFLIIAWKVQDAFIYINVYFMYINIYNIIYSIIDIISYIILYIII